jgi:predicted enzyme related to lactoylglutathione lyase
LPVSDPSASAEWFSRIFGLTVQSSEAHAAVLAAAEAAVMVTLLGPDSGVAAAHGLEWAPFNLVCEDLEAVRARLTEAGSELGPLNGDERSCFWFTATDPDGNTLLIVDR